MSKPVDICCIVFQFASFLLSGQDNNILAATFYKRKDWNNLERITFDEWIKNPSGGRSKLVGERDIAQAVYNDKYNKMLLLCGGHINYLLFRSGHDRFVIYIQMPSEKSKHLFYDVVIEFTTKDDVSKKLGKLTPYKVRFFSNDPNFIYTFAYVYNKNNLIIPELVSKIGEKALKEKPKETNPNKMVGYVKSFYFAYIFMQSRGLFTKLLWANAAPISEMLKFFKNTIVHSDRKLEYVNQYHRIESARKKGQNVQISRADSKGMAKAARNADMMVSHSKRTKAVTKARVLRAEQGHKNLHVTMAKRAKIVGKRGK